MSPGPDLDRRTPNFRFPEPFLSKPVQIHPDGFTSVANDWQPLGAQGVNVSEKISEKQGGQAIPCQQ